MTDGLVPKPSHLERVEREMKKMENEIYQETNNVMLAVSKYTFDIEPGDPELPAAWLEELQDCENEEEAALKLVELNKRKRIAQYALMPPKEAPVALQIAAKIHSGMTKARAMEGAGPKHLNLTMVSISAPNQPVPMFPEKEIKHE